MTSVLLCGMCAAAPTDVVRHTFLLLDKAVQTSGVQQCTCQGAQARALQCRLLL